MPVFSPHSEGRCRPPSLARRGRRSLQRGNLFFIPKQGNLIANGGRSEPGDADTGRYLIGESKFRKIAAPGFDDEPNLVAAMDVQQALADQPAITAVSNSE